MEKAHVGVFCEVVDDGKEVEGQAVRQDSEMVSRDACLRFGRTSGTENLCIEDWVFYLNEQESDRPWIMLYFEGQSTENFYLQRISKSLSQFNASPSHKILPFRLNKRHRIVVPHLFTPHPHYCRITTAKNSKMDDASKGSRRLSYNSRNCVDHETPNVRVAAKPRQ